MLAQPKFRVEWTCSTTTSMESFTDRRYQKDKIHNPFIHSPCQWLQSNCVLGKDQKPGLMSLQRRKERYIVIQVWKTLKGLVPNNLGIIFHDHIRLDTRCRIPLMKKNASVAAKSVYNKSCSVMGRNLWNIMPQSITSVLAKPV